MIGSNNVDAENNFNTQDVRKWNEPTPETSTVVTCTDPLKVALGLNFLDHTNDAAVRVRSYVDKLDDKSFKVDVDTWGGSMLYSGGVTMLEVFDSDRDILTGTIDTLEQNKSIDPESEYIKKITFTRPFDAPPSVVVWLTGFDVPASSPIRIKAHATKVTTHSFSLHVETWGLDSILSGAQATWIAHPSSSTHIRSGSYATSDVRSPHQSKTETSSLTSFRAGKLITPRVLSGVNMIDIDTTSNIRFKSTVSDISSEGFRWHLDTWGDSTANALGASYIAEERRFRAPSMTVKAKHSACDCGCDKAKNTGITKDGGVVPKMDSWVLVCPTHEKLDSNGSCCETSLEVEDVRVEPVVLRAGAGWGVVKDHVVHVQVRHVEEEEEPQLFVCPVHEKVASRVACHERVLEKTRAEPVVMRAGAGWGVVKDHVVHLPVRHVEVAV